MTREEILNMPAGREMDALVWMVLHNQEPNILMCRFIDGEYQPHAGYPAGHISPPNYSTSTVEAMIAVEGISGEYLIKRQEPNDTYKVCVGPAGRDEWDGEASAETFMLAVCRALVLAVMK